MAFFQDAEKAVGEPTLSAHHRHLLTKDLAASSGIQDPNSLLQSLVFVFANAHRLPGVPLTSGGFSRGNLWRETGCLVGGFSPTHLKNMRTVKLDHYFPKVRGEHSTNVWNHHLVAMFAFGGILGICSDLPDRNFLSFACCFFGVGFAVYDTPNNAQEKEKSLKFIIHLYCSIPPKWVI